MRFGHHLGSAIDRIANNLYKFSGTILQLVLIERSYLQLIYTIRRIRAPLHYTAVKASHSATRPEPFKSTRAFCSLE